MLVRRVLLTLPSATPTGCVRESARSVRHDGRGCCQTVYELHVEIEASFVRQKRLMLVMLELLELL